MEEEIKSEFHKGGFEVEDDPEILQKCLTFCTNYSLKPSDLVSSWEVYYLNRLFNEATVKNSHMEGFLMHLQNEQKEALIKEEPGLHSYSNKDFDILEYTKEDIPGTPVDRSEKLSPEPFDSTHQTDRHYLSSGKPSKLVTPFGQRTDKFVVKFSTNNLPDEGVKKEHDDENHEDAIIRRIQPHNQCSLILHGSGPESGCRFMYDRIEDRFNALENRIRKHTSGLVASGLYEEPMDLAVATQKSVFSVGMICCDGEGHLNEKSILLQSSAEHSAGKRVRLDLQKLSHFSIFPGQVVGIEGQNPSGHCLIASKLIPSIPLPPTASVNMRPAKKQALGQDTLSTDTRIQDVSMIIASGPFTTADNMFFEPLVELLAYARRKPPQLLIMLGPFVDSEHPEINKGTIDMSFDEIFHLQILRKLQDYVEYMGSATRFVLVPSIRDANHDFVFPQPAFDIHPPDITQQVSNLTNPGTFEANQVRVGCCTVDILKHLSGEELSRNSAVGAFSDRMSRLATHILSQQSFYPLYPPAEGVPLDSSLAPEALNISSVPNILILPSDMKYFVKVLSLGEQKEGEEQVRCICVNPGRLVRGEGGGTFAELTYRGTPDTMNASIISI